MELREIRSKISQIVTGQKTELIQKKSGEHVVVLFRVPPHSIKIQADVFVEKARLKAIAEGIPSLEQIKTALKDILAANQVRISRLESTLKSRKKMLENIVRRSGSSTQRASKTREIQSIDMEIERLENEQARIFATSAESKAEQVRTLYLLVNGVLNSDGGLFWENVDEFLNDRNFDTQNTIIDKYVDYIKGFSEAEIREIARNPEWNLYWTAAKITSVPLFQGVVSEWDINKLMLVHWSRFYEDIHKYPRQPSEETIKNDHALDRWIEEQNLLLEKDSRVSYSNVGGRQTTTWDVNQPFRLITQEEAEEMRKEKSNG